MSSDRRPGGVWLDRFMRFTLLFGVLYAVWAAFEVLQVVTGAEPLTGLVVIRLFVNVGTAICLVAGGFIWRRDHPAGGGA